MGKAYDVIVQPGGINTVGSTFRRVGLEGPVALISDENVAAIYGPSISERLAQSGYHIEMGKFPAGEEHKTVDTILSLWETFLKAGLERKSSVAALGGGVVGDLTGFAAATYLRGVPWVAIPTSLLAMVDASIGGKTGADLPQGKNLVGAFHPPALVLVDPGVLASLPEPELRNGLAEVVKAALIDDPYLFLMCETGWESLASRWEEVIARAIAVKVKVVNADPFEKGQRSVLNLGHTFGHAIEWASGYRIRHGEAVAIGMVGAARLSVRLNLAQPELPQRIEQTLSKLGLPTRLPDKIRYMDVLENMKFDKKRSDGKTRFVLPEAIGKVQYGISVKEEYLCDLF